MDDVNSYDGMKAAGWNLDMINQDRLILAGERWCPKFGEELNWMTQAWSQTMISTSFWGDGKVELEFGNCRDQGVVTVLVDDKEIATSKPNGEETTVKFDVTEASNLTIKTDHQSIIRLFDLKLTCGTYSQYFTSKFQFLEKNV